MIHFTEITDFQAPELDVYARLTEAQLLNRFEPKKGMFIAESPKVIERALDAGCVPVSLLVERSGRPSGKWSTCGTSERSSPVSGASKLQTVAEAIRQTNGRLQK